MANNILYFDDHTPGVKSYTPEMDDRKPIVRMEAQLGHYGKHYFIDTTEELKGRGIERLRTYTAHDLTTAGLYKVGWHQYRVTERAFRRLQATYPIGHEVHLD